MVQQNVQNHGATTKLHIDQDQWTDSAGQEDKTKSRNLLTKSRD